MKRCVVWLMFLSACVDSGELAVTTNIAPLAALGEPLRAPDQTWTYIEVAGTRCRDGSTAGVSLRLNARSKKLLIYLEGGVYCFDALTCLINPENVDDLLFNSARIEPKLGIFDRDNPRNPVRDWNIAYVPYCSGDAMGGTREQPVDVPSGPARQYFSGHLNLALLLRRIVPTFPDASDVVLTGMSAGGTSVLMNMPLVQEAFKGLRVRYIVDSSLPPLSAAALAPCLQDRMRTLWGLDRGPLSDCGASCPDPRDYWRDYALFVAHNFSDRPAGFLDAIEDAQMRSLCGVGLRECTGSLLFDSISAADFRRELLSFRDELTPLANFGTFYPQGDQHTWLKDNSFYTGSAGGTALVDWFSRIANDVPPGHHGP